MLSGVILVLWSENYGSRIWRELYGHIFLRRVSLICGHCKLYLLHQAVNVKMEEDSTKPYRWMTGSVSGHRAFALTHPLFYNIAIKLTWIQTIFIS